MKDEEEAGKYHSIEDATEALRNLSAEQKRRLAAVAKRRA